jgi:hypothetical protein
MEPLTCRGRRGTGDPGNRLGYADASLAPKYDWQKYLYWYRVNGRLMYNPATSPEVWQRLQRSPHAETALAKASRILPLITTAHLPSAACDAFWPEIYWNQPIVAVARQNPYGDSPAPKTFCNVSPLDPQLFSRITDFADEIVKGERSGKYSPIEVAQWLDNFANEAAAALAKAGKIDTPEFRRLAIDVDLQILLGRFFAAKFRAGVSYSIHEKSGNADDLHEAIRHYRTARDMWAQMKQSASAYASDLSCSDKFSERGQWNDRLALIDEDISQMEQRLAASPPTNYRPPFEEPDRSSRKTVLCRHQPPPRFRRTEALPLQIAVSGKVTSVRMYYRHVNQAERFESIDMQLQSGTYHATIPANYTDSPYPLQYYFELKSSPANAWLYPGFAPNLLNQPYYVLGS